MSGAGATGEARPPAGLLPPVLLVGCGRMGGALLHGWLARGARELFVVEPRPAHAGEDAARVVPDVDALPPGFAPEAVVLAVKPQSADAVLPAYRRFADAGAVFVSIMAGRDEAGLQRLLGGNAKVVRAMPNTPAAIGRGFTVARAGAGVDAARRLLAEALLAAVGEVAWVEEETMLDAVTAVSGGGPAYVFLLAELLESAAREQGLPAELARRMARATVAGSGALLGESEEDAAVLRRAVTSPGGTTERALAVLMANGAWPALVARAVDAATERCRALRG